MPTTATETSTATSTATLSTETVITATLAETSINTTTTTTTEPSEEITSTTGTPTPTTTANETTVATTISTTIETTPTTATETKLDLNPNIFTFGQTSTETTTTSTTATETSAATANTTTTESKPDSNSNQFQFGNGFFSFGGTSTEMTTSTATPNSNTNQFTFGGQGGFSFGVTSTSNNDTFGSSPTTTPFGANPNSSGPTSTSTSTTTTTNPFGTPVNSNNVGFGNTNTFGTANPANIFLSRTPLGFGNDNNNNNNNNNNNTNTTTPSNVFPPLKKSAINSTSTTTSFGANNTNNSFGANNNSFGANVTNNNNVHPFYTGQVNVPPTTTATPTNNNPGGFTFATTADQANALPFTFGGSTTSKGNEQPLGFGAPITTKKVVRKGRPHASRGGTFMTIQPPFGTPLAEADYATMEPGDHPAGSTFPVSPATPGFPIVENEVEFFESNVRVCLNLWNSVQLKTNYNSSQKCLKLLLEKGVNVNQTTNSNETALSLCCKISGNFDDNALVCKLLFEAGAKLDLQNSLGDTVFHDLAKIKAADAIQLLISREVWRIEQLYKVEVLPDEKEIIINEKEIMSNEKEIIEEDDKKEKNEKNEKDTIQPVLPVDNYWAQHTNFGGFAPPNPDYAAYGGFTFGTTSTERNWADTFHEEDFLNHDEVLENILSDDEDFQQYKASKYEQDDDVLINTQYLPLSWKFSLPEDDIVFFGQFKKKNYQSNVKISAEKVKLLKELKSEAELQIEKENEKRKLKVQEKMKFYHEKFSVLFDLLDIRNNRGCTPLLCASFHETKIPKEKHDLILKKQLEECVQILFPFTIDLNCQEKELKKSVLHNLTSTTEQGFIEILKREPSFDYNIRDNFGNTPLIYAINNSYFEAAHKLASLPSVDVNVQGFLGHTAFHSLLYTFIPNLQQSNYLFTASPTDVLKKTEKLIDVLLRRSDRHLLDNNLQTMLHLAIPFIYQPNYRTSFLRTILTFATTKNLDTLDSTGETPLMKLIKFSSTLGKSVHSLKAEDHDVFFSNLLLKNPSVNLLSPVLGVSALMLGAKYLDTPVFTKMLAIHKGMRSSINI
jgi:ankyrin repeat protein